MTSLKESRAVRIVDRLRDEEVLELIHDWSVWARPEQLAPPGNWATWLLMGGRGSGKTRAGAEWVRQLVFSRAGNGTEPFAGPVALVSRTMAEARAVMVEGPAGLLSIGPPRERPRFERSRNLLTWPNGVTAVLMSASEPDRFRGPQFAAAWCDEVAKWPGAEQAWDMLQFGLRLGADPRQMVTTTPRPTRLVRRLVADENTVLTRMRTRDNEQNLAPRFLKDIVGRYRGTFLGRQELEGELIEDLPGALWNRKGLEEVQTGSPPEMGRIVVSVDPSVSSGSGSDACGIIIAGRTGQGAIVLADRTVRAVSPLNWAARVVEAFHRFSADAVVAEVNQGGELVSGLIAQVDPQVPVIQVRASRSKWVRAEPVAALYERGLVRHCPGLFELEDEMCAFGPDGMADGHSADRVDALVWALTTLLLHESTPRVRTI